MGKNKKLDFSGYADKWLRNEKIRQMCQLMHHRDMSILDHAYHVAYKSYKIAMHCPFRIDTDSVVTMAFLHDYFLYDRKIPHTRLYHSYRHPVIAAENAMRDFNITDKEYLGILTHMWPQVFWLVPRSREAWVLCIADKLCAVGEYIGFGRKFQEKTS